MLVLECKHINRLITAASHLFHCTYRFLKKRYYTFSLLSMFAEPGGSAFQPEAVAAAGGSAFKPEAVA